MNDADGTGRIKVGDEAFEDGIVERVGDHGNAYGNAWSISPAGSSGPRLEKSYGVEPKAGQRVRTYSEPGPLGDRVRGVDLDGKEVFYRTPEEDRELYGKLVQQEAAEVRAKCPDADARYRTVGLPFMDALALGEEERLGLGSQATS